MIGKTNSQTGGVLRGEKLNISLKTNQSSHSDLIGAVITITHAGGTTEHVWGGSEFTVEVPPYVEYSVEYGKVEGYATPAKFTATAVKDNARTLTAEYKTTIVTVNMADNQSSLNDIANATAAVAASGITTKTVKTGQSVKVPTGVSCTVTWGALADYKSPSAQTFTTSGTSAAKTGTYQTELVSVSLNADNGASVNGVKVTINGKSHTWNGTAITQKVAFGTTYSVSVGALDGFSTPSAQNNISASQASRSLTFTYIASALKVNILSNQGTDATIAAVKATVKYGSTTLQVSNGQQIDIPTDQEVTITFPSVEGYKTPDTIKFTNTNGGVVEKTGTYQTQLLTVNVTYSGTAPSGYTITGKDSGGNVLFTQSVAFATHKIPYGTSYTVSASKLDGYDAVASQSGTANSTSNTITMMYVHNPVKDLSKFDIYGNAISQTTANCYVVSKADTYKIPLVFGNALKNGSTNSAAYTNNGGNYGHDFVDYNGTVVTSPYIEAVSGTASSAQLSIADTDGIFTDISIVDGSPCRYLQFKVNSIPATGANGVLSIKDSSGVIMWSWHIWVWLIVWLPLKLPIQPRSSIRFCLSTWLPSGTVAARLQSRTGITNSVDQIRCYVLQLITLQVIMQVMEH